MEDRVSFGEVRAVSEGGAVIRLGDGRELLVRGSDFSRLSSSPLVAGAWVVVRLRGDSVARIEAPGAAATSGSPASRAVQPSSVQPERSATVHESGRIAQVGERYTAVRGDDDLVYGFVPSRFPDLAPREGDRVAFEAVEQTREIVSIAVLERAPLGRGGSNPCGGLLSELADLVQRPALLDLARHFCAERSLEWYWITPGREALRSTGWGGLPPDVIAALRAAEPRLEFLFAHQSEALEALDQGRHVLVLTPTASGKTYCYNPAVFRAVSRDPAAHALYVFPLNALLADQVGKLKATAEAFGTRGERIGVEVLIGGLSREDRDRVQLHPPQMIVTNPEMLSWVLDRNEQGGWPEFFRQLRFVVLDEVHTYRGLLGLHMAGLMRRLLLACRRHGNPGPQLVLSSATVGAPEELATRLTSLPLDAFTIIGEDADGSLQQQRHWMVLDPIPEEVQNPHNAHLYQAALALVDAVTVPREDLNAILFARSIRDVHHVHRMAERLLESRGREDLIPKVTRFASALLSPREKQRIYEGLRDGTLRAVVSTNALEAGIDIGKLDVCILAGFPFHVMRMRQMAGRAGRQREGAVIYVPHPALAVDKFYRKNPERLLTQPPEVFVVDHENYYIGRKHVVAAAASTTGGVHHSELAPLYGRGLDRIVQEALEERVMWRTRGGAYAARRRWDKGDPWAVGNMRSQEQNPYSICSAPAGAQLPCGSGVCSEIGRERAGGEQCPHLAQLLDRQYVYRDAHPGAVFEDYRGNLHLCTDLDEARKRVAVQNLRDDCLDRTFSAEATSVQIVEERGWKKMSSGATLHWGDVRVTREYAGYYEYHLIPRRRCRPCGKSYDATVDFCPSCRRRTRPYLDSSRPEYVDFPGAYQELTYRIELETIACWLVLPASLDSRLAPASECKIPGPHNPVTAFLKAQPPYRSTARVASALGLPSAEAEAVFRYFEAHRGRASRRSGAKDGVSIYPAFYGQCLLYGLRQQLPEDKALAAFARVTRLPVATDETHVCRDCVGSVLLTAAHTVEHLVALAYPTVALGDSQDLGFTTSVLHPSTQGTTVFWYDNYDGGIGAAEKIYTLFETLLHRAEESLECDCRSDEGCPLCTQTLHCDRRNAVLGKASARCLVHLLMGKPAYVPDEPIHWAEDEAPRREQEARAREQQRGSTGTARAAPSGPDPFLVLRVQKHVHDAVLERALEVRGEEIGTEVPAVSISELQDAYRCVLGSQRPDEWGFRPEWTDYQVLHVHPEASTRLAHAAYKRIIACVHPDHNPERAAWATEMTKRLNAAWEHVRTGRKD